jgi:regulator of sigma E protease
MVNLLSIIGAVLILSFLVVIHELGHYWAAKKNGIKVPEFGVGFPPKLFKFVKDGTEFSINLIPFGGYVKLHGEDSHDPKVLKDKTSFASKTPWQKIEVIIAGVVMNFLVFWILMTIALWNGVDPTITSQDDFKRVVNEGYYNLKPVVLVEDSKDSRFKQGDIVTKINGSSEFELETAVSLVQGDLSEIKSFELKSGNSLKEVIIDQKNQPELDFYPLSSVPTFEITNVSEASLFNQILEPGDVLYAVNGMAVFDTETFVNEVLGSSGKEIVLDLVRVGEIVSLTVPASPKNQYYIEQVVPGSSAEKEGLKAGDKIIAVDGLMMTVSDDIPGYIKNKGLERVVFSVLRAGEELDLTVTPNADGLVGMYLTVQTNLTDVGLDFVQSSELGSVVQVKDYRVPLYQAPFVALTEGYKIAKATVIGFTSTVYGIVANFRVSEEVGGPVQVAKLSYMFVEKGGIDLINFIALISLSLAVINLLPIPALDGGRLVFIIIEALRGKPINPRAEALIHTVGFMLLIGLILIITVSDIIRL